MFERDFNVYIMSQKSHSVSRKREICMAREGPLSDSWRWAGLGATWPWCLTRGLARGPEHHTLPSSIQISPLSLLFSLLSTSSLWLSVMFDEGTGPVRGSEHHHIYTLLSSTQISLITVILHHHPCDFHHHNHIDLFIRPLLSHFHMGSVDDLHEDTVEKENIRQTTDNL